MIPIKFGKAIKFYQSTDPQSVEFVELYVFAMRMMIGKIKKKSWSTLLTFLCGAAKKPVRDMHEHFESKYIQLVRIWRKWSSTGNRNRRANIKRKVKLMVKKRSGRNG